jgi:hypothetical protein
LRSAPSVAAFDVLAASVTNANGDPSTPQVPDTGIHVWRQAQQGGSLMIVGLLLLILGTRRRRRGEGRALS